MRTWVRGRRKEAPWSEMEHFSGPQRSKTDSSIVPQDDMC